MKPTFFIAAIALMIAVGTVAAETPTLPCFFYGGVTINGSPAPAGTVITALIGGQTVGQITTTSSGQYDQLMVSDGSEGATVTFYVNGVLAPQTGTFHAEQSVQVNLAVTVVTPTPTTTTTTPTPTPTVTPTPTPTPVPAPVIAAGGDVFIGEQGLDITQALAGATVIAWVDPANPNVTLPSAFVTVDNPTNFFVDPAKFIGKTGIWYRWVSGAPAGTAFIVKDPELALSIWKPVSNGLFGKAGAKEYLGTPLNFRIDTNLYTITQRSGFNPATDNFANIIVQSPKGVNYSHLVTVSSLSRSLLKLPDFTKSIFFWSGNENDTANYWATDARDQGVFRYEPGQYTVWANATANRMNESYDVEGKTKSSVQSISLLQPIDKVILTVNTTVTRSNKIVVDVAGKPDTQYYLWIKDNFCPPQLDGTDCKQPPRISPNQLRVQFDPVNGPYTIGDTIVFPVCCLPNTTIRDTVPGIPNNGVEYYALVATGPELNDGYGHVSVEFFTTSETAIQSYNVHVQSKDLDPIVYADATFSVVKGAITLDLVPSTAILGDKIIIKGTNYDSDMTYLYVTGPCLPVCGAGLETPKDPGTVTPVAIFTDRTWEYNRSVGGWDTSKLSIDAGEYTIFASSKPINPCHPDVFDTCVDCTPDPCIECAKPCAAWTKKTLTLERPSLSATICPDPLIMDCDDCSHEVVIQGNATGNPLHEISVWVFGEGKVGDKHYYHAIIDTCVANNCDAFKFKLSDLGVDIESLKTGKYFILIQHPMYNHVFDVILEGDPVPDPDKVPHEQNMKFVLSSCPVRWSKEFPIEGPGAKFDLAALSALKQVFEKGCVDDKYLVLNFTVKDADAPTVDFTANKTSGNKPLTIQFTDNTTGDPVSWDWAFGDGKFSTEQNPIHTYSDEGVYSVRLTATNSLGKSNSITKEGYITVGGQSVLEAAFTATPRSGQAPLTVDFIDQSKGTSPIAYLWNFGDGSTTSTERNPTHIYTSPGSYTVTLTVTNAGGSNTHIEPNFLIVNGPSNVTADFTVSPTSGIVPLTVQFLDKSGGNPTSWMWEFGDGTTSSLQSPQHTYTTPATYTPRLTVSNAGGVNTKIGTSILVAHVPPVAQFDGSPRSGIVPFTVQFTDQSTGDAITQWFWTFGDGGTSTEKNPIHTYQKGGPFTVVLMVANDGGADTEIKDAFISSTVQAPHAVFTASPLTGPVPLTVSFTDHSTGSIPLSYHWNFGDGGMSNVQNPTYTYTNSGTFTVNLTVSNAAGTDSATQIIIPNGPSADFTASPTSGVAPLTVSFTDLSVGNPTGWFWTFGDGGSSSDRNPVHIYPNPGLYTVSLLVQNSYGTTSKTVPNLINVGGTPTPTDITNITLNPGWNYVSVPKVLKTGHDTASVVFAGVNMAAHSAFLYNASTGFWDPLQAATPITPLNGYWIYSANTHVVTLVYPSDSTTPPPIPQKQLYAGWNAVGFSDLVPITAQNALINLQGKWNKVIGFDSSHQIYENTIYPDTPGTVYPTHGYWVLMNSPGILQ